MSKQSILKFVADEPKLLKSLAYIPQFEPPASEVLRIREIYAEYPNAELRTMLYVSNTKFSMRFGVSWIINRMFQNSRKESNIIRSAFARCIFGCLNLFQ